MYTNLYDKFLKSKYCAKCSNIEHYNFYIVMMITGIFYMLESKINIPHYNSIFMVIVLSGSAYLYLVHSKASIVEYVLVAIVMLLIKSNIIMFSNACNIIMQISLLTSSIVGILVNYRFNIDYRKSIAFLCLSLILTSFVLDNFVSKFTLFVFAHSTYDALIIGIIAADVALLIGMFSSIGHFNKLFEKKICGIGLNIISKYVKILLKS